MHQLCESSDTSLTQFSSLYRSGGVLLPDSVDVNTIREGTVVAAGPGRTSSSGALVPLGLKVGDVVVFPKDDYVGKKIKMEGEDFLLMREEDVFGKKL